MADFYSTGTITATNNSATITGSGTAWQTAGVSSGDIVYIPETGGPVPYGVATVDSETQITLQSVYKGSTASGKTYYAARMYGVDAATDTYRLLNEYVAALNSSTVVQTQIGAAAAKTTPVDGDLLGILDSAASNALKQLTFGNLWIWVYTKIAGVSTKATPVDADGIAIVDSAASNVPKRVLFSALWTWVQGKYAAVAAKNPPVGADSFNIFDSAASDAPKKLTLTNLITFLNDYFLKKSDGSWTMTYTVASGSAVNFTGLPAGVNEIEIAFDNLSLSGTDHILVQIGDSGGLETTGYLSASDTNASTQNSTSGFIVILGTAANVLNGMMRLSLFSADGLRWLSMHGARTGTVAPAGGGQKVLSAALDRVSVVPTGANTFDGGGVVLRYR